MSKESAEKIAKIASEVNRKLKRIGKNNISADLVDVADVIINETCKKHAYSRVDHIKTILRLRDI